ncbi:hypothetical protein [Paracoccus sp. SY]|uniref:hypothetical protein n=1 Tax=Paracoccus sp. SY TaxID=1330255 RepID=UPI000CCFED87|nr:hypothetical protein [Paracoccus sp. SY]
MTEGMGVRVESGEAVIRLPEDARNKLVEELAPCPCVAPKSIATTETRQAFLDALPHQPVRWPVSNIHGLRVALGDCACRGPQPSDTIRHRLSVALGKLRV